jgi:hypothetical protein
MAKTVYTFKLGTRNFYGLTFDQHGGNLPGDTWDKWRPFKATGKLGLSDEVLNGIAAKGFYTMRGLKIVAVRPGVLARPAPKKKKKK